MMLLAKLVLAVATLSPVAPAETEVFAILESDVVSLERYDDNFDLLKLKGGDTRLVPTDAALKKILKMRVDLAQATDELAIAKAQATVCAKENELSAANAELYRNMIDSERKHSDQLVAIAGEMQVTFRNSIDDIKKRTDQEIALKDKELAKAKGSKFLNAVKSGLKVSAGIGIGIAIGRVIQ